MQGTTSCAREQDIACQLSLGAYNDKADAQRRPPCFSQGLKAWVSPGSEPN
jgi:hypothetical protein